MNRTFFITATGTGSGKTLAAAALLRGAQERHHKAMVMKPVETGSRTGANDADWALSFSLVSVPANERQTLHLYRLPLPASPHLAAREAGVTIEIATILKALEIVSARWDVVIIEGAGGLLVPLNERETIADLIAAAAAEPVLVVNNQLGALNHTALTLNEMRQRGIEPNLVILNTPTPSQHPDDVLIRSDNAAMIRAMAIPVPVIEQPFAAPLDAAAVSSLGHCMADGLGL